MSYTILDADDWIGIYKGTDIIYQGSYDLRPRDLLLLLGFRVNTVEVYDDAAMMDVLDDLGRFPGSLTEWNKLTNADS